MATGARNIIFLTILFFQHFLVELSGQQVRTWIGTGNWGTNTNWSPSGNYGNSRLVFSGSGNQVSNHNGDFNTNPVRRLTFQGNVSYTITGNPIRLTNAAAGAQGAIRQESFVLQSISAPLFFDDNNRLGYIGTFQEGPIEVGDVELGSKITVLRLYGNFTQGHIKVGGSISGSNQITIGFDEANQLKPNTRVVFSNDNSAFSGPVLVQNGVLVFEQSNADGNSSENLIDVSSGAALEIRGGITLLGKSLKIQGSGISNGGVIRNTSGTNNIFSNVLVNSNVRIEAADNSVLNLGNVLKESNPVWNLTFTTSGALSGINLTGSVGQLGTGAFGDLTKLGVGTLLVAAPLHCQKININAGRLVLASDHLIQPGIPVNISGGTLRTGATIGYQQEFGALSLGNSNNSRIELGSGNHIIRFDNSRNEIWAANRKLTISGWQGLEGQPGTAGRIFVIPAEDLNPGLTEAQLNQIVFEGPWNCDGAMLLPTGELVPSNLAFISSVTSTPNALSGGFNGYVGNTVTISGCKLNNTSLVTIGSVSLTPPAITINAPGTSITFPLPDNASGLVSVTIPAGTRTHPTSFVNLGYITTSPSPNTEQNWITGPPTWQGLTIGNPPPANRSVRIAHRQVVLTAPVAPINTGNPLLNAITIQSNNNANSPALRIAANGLLLDAPPLILGTGASLRTYNGAVNLNEGAPTGHSVQFGTLTLTNNASIALGSGLHELRFAASDQMNWTQGTSLVIYGWKGSLGQSGIEGRVYFGNSSTALTEAQLRQIRFDGYCAKVVIRPDGEIIPSNQPFAPDIVGIPGGLNNAYIGGEVVINGCLLGSVTAVKIGDIEVPDITVTEGSIQFIYPEGIPGGFVTLMEGVVEGEKSVNPLVNNGYITAQGGLWEENDTWLGGFLPVENNAVTINHALTVTNDLVGAAKAESLTVTNTGELRVSQGAVLEVGSFLRNDGIIELEEGGILDITGRATLTNNGNFNQNGFGEVHLRRTTTINTNSSQPIYFNNLNIYQDSIFLPSRNVAAQAAIIPVIKSNLRIYGGQFFSGGNTTNVGPRYQAGSNLIYTSGNTYTRGGEWVSNDIFAEDFSGFPYNIIIENNTTLSIGHNPTPEPTNLNPSVLTLRGDLIINRGSVVHAMQRPFKVRGSVIIGLDGSAASVLNMSSGNASSNLIIEGDLVVRPNSQIQYGGSSNRRIIFSGAQNSIVNIQNPNVTSGLPTFNFLNLEINKTGAELILANPTSVSQSLIFNTGFIRSDENNYLLLQEVAEPIGANAISFVNGTIRKQISALSPNISDGFEFPIGKLDNEDPLFRPVILNDFVHSGLTTYTAEFKKASTGESPLQNTLFIDPLLQGIWADEWWQTAKTGEGSSRVGIPFIPEPAWHPVAPCISCQVGVAFFNDDGAVNSWQLTKITDFAIGQPYPELLSNNNYDIVYSAPVSKFGAFSIGHIFNQPLPVQLFSFSAQLLNRDGLITWRIADAVDLRHFELEHSIDGRVFEKLATIYPREHNEYKHLHPRLNPGIHYYRLKILEKDGQVRYSRTELLQVGNAITIVEGLLQNPVYGGKAIVKIQSASNQTADVLLFDILGRAVLSQKIALVSGHNLAPVSLLPLPKGQYRLLIRTADGVEKALPLLK
jgi:hypothetical protein